MNDKVESRSDSLDALETLFFKVLEQPAGQREDYVAHVCAGNGALRKSLQALLRADGDTTGLIHTAPWSVQQIEARISDGTGADPTAKPCAAVGRYTLLEFLGSGGMGTVWLAERNDDEFRQRVALKLIKRGLDTDDILRRFRRERQVLAQLEHPNIARLIDGGATDDGRPYLVMEYVNGEPIDRWCDQKKLNIRNRLKLFLSVCSAVQYAHSKLTVHRDLKPGNILIGEDDQPKLLDFGLAKILREDGQSDSIIVTSEDHRFLTPRYASPEQVRGEVVSTATDVYSLGVMLYELLCGFSPYPLASGTQREIEQAIVHLEPVRPSLAGMLRGRPADGKSDSPTILARRSTSESGLRRAIRGDLDTIVLTALQKDPQRRYATVEMFATDIDRYLRGLPISAAPDSLTYRASRFVRRNKGLVAGLVTAVLALMVATGVSTTYAIRARQAQVVAEDRTRVAESINEFLNEDLLASADPKNTKNPDLTVREALSRAAETLDQRFRGQPIVEAAIRHTIGETYLGLRLPAEAVPHLRRAAELRKQVLGELDSSTRLSMRELFTALFESDQFDEATGKDFGTELLELDIQAAGTESADAMDTRYLIAQIGSGDIEADIVTYQTLLDWNRRNRGVENARTLSVMHSLANLLLIKQRYAEAGPLIEEIWIVTQQVYEPADAEYLDAMLGRALFYGRTGRGEEAVAILREAVQILKSTRSPDFADTGIYLTHLGIHLRTPGRWEEAEAAFLEAYEILSASLGPDAGWTRGTARFLFELYEKNGDAEQAAMWKSRSTETEVRD